MVRQVGIWIGGLTATLALGFLFLIFNKVAAPVIQTDPAAALQLNARLKQAEGAASAASPQVVRADQTEVNSVIDSYLKKDSQGQIVPTSIRDFRLKIIEDRVRMYLVLDLRGRNLTVELEGKMHAKDGFLQFDPLSGRIGALPIPKSTLVSRMQAMMDSPEMRESLRLPANVKDVYVEDGRIVATFD